MNTKAFILACSSDELNEIVSLASNELAKRTTQKLINSKSFVIPNRCEILDSSIISAIRSYRERSGYSLTDCKRIIEYYRLNG
jgi:hypothetical protein